MILWSIVSDTKLSTPGHVLHYPSFENTGNNPYEHFVSLTIRYECTVLLRNLYVIRLHEINLRIYYLLNNSGSTIVAYNTMLCVNLLIPNILDVLFEVKVLGTKTLTEQVIKN